MIDENKIMEDISADIEKATALLEVSKKAYQDATSAHWTIVEEEDKVWNTILPKFDYMDSVPEETRKKLTKIQKRVDNSRKKLTGISSNIVKAESDLIKFNDPFEYDRRLQIEINKIERAEENKNREKKPPKYKVNKEGMREKHCVDCNKSFTQEIKRGKPFIRCEDCRNTKTEKEAAKKTDYETNDKGERLTNCAICEKVFSQPIKRGRPAVKCPDCR